ncbi:MAG: hypothetical protein P1P82_04380 [Bacteroidales bacterium]|nr:hypothetical protein [Bacteroidales bacterium]MDT8432038.1 hypothetical protein [Bacteroidales bacterium]
MKNRILVLILLACGTFTLNGQQYHSQYHPWEVAQLIFDARRECPVYFSCPGSYPSETEYHDWVLFVNKKE